MRYCAKIKLSQTGHMTVWRLCIATLVLNKALHEMNDNKF